MDEINRTTGRTLGRIVPSQRRDHSANSSERAPRTVASSGTAHGGTFQKSRVVDIRKNLMARHQFTQVAAEHPRACLNDMSWNPATSDQVILPGSRHLIIGDSLVRDLNEIFVYGQTTTLSFGGASVAQVIKMMEFQSKDHLDTLVIMLGTNDVSSPSDSGEQVGASIGMPLERTKGEVQAQACSAVHDTTKPAGGHHSGRFHEWQRDTVEGNDPQSGEKQPWRAATSGSREHAAHD